jgi:hypothetical protein
VNAIDLVLSQEPLQGKAILEQFGVDVQSSGFPNAQAKIFDYVEQRYLTRVRPHNIKNFGMVLAKSLLKGIPSDWEIHRQKVLASLIAVRDRAAGAWPNTSDEIIRLIDNLEPGNRSRAIAFIATFTGFWGALQSSTRIALQETVNNIDVNEFNEFRVLMAVNLTQFRSQLLDLVEKFSATQLREAIAIEPLADLWPKAIRTYKESGSYRRSEINFIGLIAPFSGRLKSQQHDQLLDAVIGNAQNWDAARTPESLVGLFKNSEKSDYPTIVERDRFYTFLHSRQETHEYEDFLKMLQTDGWGFPPVEPETDDDE